MGERFFKKNLFCDPYLDLVLRQYGSSKTYILRCFAALGLPILNRAPHMLLFT